MFPTRVMGSYFDATARRIEANLPEPQPPVRTPEQTPTGIEGTPKTISLLPPTVTPALGDYINTITPSFLTPAQNTANIVKAAIKSTWKVDIDPGKARIATFNYQIGEAKPADGKLLNSITLTDAALNNMREKNPEDESLNAQQPWWRKMLGVVEKGSPLAGAIMHTQGIINDAHTHEYIIPAFSPDPKHAYQNDEKLHHTPQSFRDLMRQTELSAPYKAHLDKFWPANEAHYLQLSKLSFATAAQAQHKEGSLNDHEVDMVMRAIGVGSGKRLSNLTVEELKAPFSKDPLIETGFLSVNGTASTDLVYVTDKQVSRDTNNKEVNATLLYIPGNSSPIHRFDSVAQMKTWLADQAADPVKRAQLCTHFSENAQDDKVFSDGVKQSLIGLGGWTEAQKPNKLGFTSINEWNPQTYITADAVNADPFAAMTQRHKARSYMDAAHEIITDRDVVKSRLITLAEAATVAALMLTPLALVVPEVAMGVDAVYVAAGVAQASIGIDDVRHDKSAGTDRIVFGALNAAPGIAQGASKLVAGQLEEATSTAIELDGMSDSKSVDLNLEEVFSDEAKQEGVQRVTLDTSVRDLQYVDETFFTFVDTYKGADRLNIVVHGRELGFLEKKYQLPTDAMLNGFASTPEELQGRLWGDGIETDDYDNVRLIMCYSGSGGDESFAAKFHQLIGKPVKAYVGPVDALFNSKEIERLYKKALKSKSGVEGLERRLTAENQPVIIKDNPFSSDPTSPEYQQYLGFKYRPVHFPARIG